ncbi:unnamed protein product, partial [Choristocarpus tenellus]
EGEGEEEEDAGEKGAIATRLGGRTRKASAKYQEFKQVQRKSVRQSGEPLHSRGPSRLSNRATSGLSGVGRSAVQRSIVKRSVGNGAVALSGAGAGAGASALVQRGVAGEPWEVKVDTIVLAKCRRKSQTMWPARVCSRREVLERLKEAPASDDGVDPRNECLVMFLCEGGHHVMDWVSPGVMRPYQSHASAYPYKKRAYVGTARLQPDFAAAEAWADGLKSIVKSIRAEVRAARRLAKANAASGPEKEALLLKAAENQDGAITPAPLAVKEEKEGTALVVAGERSGAGDCDIAMAVTGKKEDVEGGVAG